MHLATFRDPTLSPGGRTITRTAARGVLIRGPELLLLSSRHGDYKFPGGGLEPGESFEQALHREFREECGYGEILVGPELATTREEVAAIDAEYDVFGMTSYYFECSGGAPLGEQHLEGYEAELELTPSWVTVEAALAANRSVLASGVGVMRWLVREIAVLEWLSERSR
ncbi:NUDIX domain-containing protein [Kribbella sp. VKM Ac-2571]|uniref:NUDIX domain-containing protein n=1 Tax=Kribbella sp. VKM Ac-2571 TaxID=2512222 RepID=UPI00105C2101|nr:NUDIX domain-containing protein [Kribbella sp. VKM Ac-2571]TDO60984.1 NUDIX domain-containing protein [Kribbella sp. VKM Ac-2571]